METNIIRLMRDKYVHELQSIGNEVHLVIFYLIFICVNYTWYIKQ